MYTGMNSMVAWHLTQKSRGKYPTVSHVVAGIAASTSGGAEAVKNVGGSTLDTVLDERCRQLGGGWRALRNVTIVCK